MKIEDAIEKEVKTAGHKRGAAENCRAKLNNPNYPWGRDWTKEQIEEKERNYIKEAEEHQQMAEWLEELLHFRAIGTVSEFREAMFFKKYFMELYGEGLEVANWHQNGDLEPLDNFIDEAFEWGKEKERGEHDE